MTRKTVKKGDMNDKTGMQN